MKNKIILSFLLIALAVPFSGCALFLIGAGAAGGYAISKDEIEGLVDGSSSRAWTAAREVIMKEGVLKAENAALGTLEAEVGSSTVEIHAEQVTAKTTRLRIKARKTKGLFPDIELAQQTYTKIVKKLG